MSELKAGVIHTPHDEGMTFVTDSDTISVNERETEFYLKSEADKVIAELEERIADGDKDFEISNNQNERLMKIVRHHKHKRCLAMARWCESEEKRLEAIAPLFDTDKECWEYNSNYLVKWHKRWLKIAEKFNEAK